MEKLLRFLPGFAFLSIAFGAPNVLGQTLTLDPRTGFEIVREDERFTNEFPLILSREDCFDASTQRFTDASDPAETGDFTWIEIIPTVTGAQANDFLQVWISEGDDCLKSENRTGSAAPCSLVYQTGDANVRNPTLNVNPRDVVERARDSTYEVGAAGKEDTCEADRNQIETQLIFFILLLRGTQVQANVTWEQTSLDLAAPAAPDSIDIGAGDTHIFFEWEVDAANEEDDTEGFTFYCVPNGTIAAGMGGASGLGGAAAMNAAEGGAGGASSTSCGQNVLVEGEIAGEEAEAYKCGEVLGRATRKGQADGLENNVTYAVGIASQDAVGNSGELSAIECMTPKEVTTFYEGYKNAGGRGGGGFCNLGSKKSTSLLWLALTTCSVLVLRRRRLSA